MQMMLFRHGIAEDAGPTQPDAERPLTSRGRTRTQAAAEGLAKVYDPPRRLLSSPKVRAHQTAEIVAEAFDCAFETWAPLGNADAAVLRERVQQFHAASPLMLVGHEPSLNELLELMCFDRIFGQTDMKKASCAILDVPDDGEHATLQALLPAKVFAGR